MVLALQDLKVLDFTQTMAGPFCTMLLGDMGADIIKVERPEGDGTRKMAGATEIYSPAFAAVNRNKRSIVLNLKQARGQDVARRLAGRADVLVESFRPGTMAALGLDYTTLQTENPGLIYASVSGFGQTGPYAHRGGFDLVAQGMAGIMSVTGEAGRPPTKCGIPVTDLGAGLLALYGILSALISRGRTGVGQQVDTSLFEAGVSLSVWEAAQFFAGRGVPEPMGSAHRMQAPYQAIRCCDGYINIGGANDRVWQKFAALCGHPEWCQDARFQTAGDRVANRQALIETIEAITTQHACAHWLERCEQAGIPVGPILTYDQVFADPHVQARDLIWSYDHSAAGPKQTLGNPVKMSATPATLRLSPPRLGEHTREILAAAGYPPDEIDALLACGAVS